VQRPIFVDAVHPFDTIERHVFRKVPYGPSLTAGGVVVGLGVGCLIVFAIQEIERHFAKKLPSMTPEWKKAEEERRTKFNVHNNPIQKHKIGSADDVV